MSEFQSIYVFWVNLLFFSLLKRKVFNYFVLHASNVTKSILVFYLLKLCRHNMKLLKYTPNFFHQIPTPRSGVVRNMCALQSFQ